MLSHSIDWHLLDVVHNILNMRCHMQRCHISDWSDRQLQWQSGKGRQTISLPQ